MHGPTCIFWANLTPLSLKRGCGATKIVLADCGPGGGFQTPQMFERLRNSSQVRKTPSWPRSWANFSLF